MTDRRMTFNRLIRRETERVDDPADKYLFDDSETVVVTSHEVTYEYIKDTYLSNTAHFYVQRATIDDIYDKTVWGSLPLHLACRAKRLIVVPIIRPSHLRDSMTYEDIELFARDPVIYRVTQVND